MKNANKRVILFKKIKVEAIIVFLFSKNVITFQTFNNNIKRRFAGASLPKSLYLFTLNKTKIIIMKIKIFNKLELSF